MISWCIIIKVLNPSPASVTVSKNASVGTVKPVQRLVRLAGLQEEEPGRREDRKEVTLGDKERQ